MESRSGPLARLLKRLGWAWASLFGQVEHGTALDFIFARRSVRKFKDVPLEAHHIDSLLKAAMAAPTACDKRPWEFVVVTDAGLLEQLRAVLPAGRFKAPAAIAVCADKKRDMTQGEHDGHWLQDLSAATENLLIAASGLGLGAVWIGVYPMENPVADVSKILALPRHVVPMALVYVGHPAQFPMPRTTYEPEKVHWQRYGQTPP